MRTRLSPLRRAAALVLALGLSTSALAGCGGFAKSGSTDAADDDAEVGGGIELETTTTTTSAVGANGSPDGQGGTAGGAGDPVPADEGFANVSERTDPSGFKLTLTIDGKLRYSTKDNVRVQLEVENVGKRVLRYDSNQVRYFQMKPADGRSSPTWSDEMCDSEKTAYEGPPVDLEPGEQITLAVSSYPSDDPGPNGEKCRVLTPGRYTLVGAISWCPDDAYRDGMCDPSGIKPVSSSPLVVTFV